MNNKKKNNFLSYFVPYLLVAAVIIIIIVLFGNFRTTPTAKLSKQDIVTVTVSEDDYILASGAKTDEERQAASDEYMALLSESFLCSANVQQLNVVSKPSSELMNVSGTYIDINESGKEITYQFSVDMDYSGSITCVSEIIRLRKTSTGNAYYVVGQNLSYSDPYASSWTDYLPTIILMVGGIALVIFLFSRMSSSINKSNNSALDFNRSRARREDASPVRFDDVAGCDECKAEMVELVDYLRNPDKYSKFGAKLPKGVLLVGPPGTGKTLLAKAVAGEAKVPFYSISGSDFVEMFVGVGAGRVRDMFKKAKQTAPCLIFIDEIDAVGRQRGAGLGGGNDEREQTLNQLLVEMDGFGDNSGIIVIAATNRDDVLDPALLRAGRFDRKITVDLPDKEGREAILKVHARNKKISPDVDFANIAKRTVGFSGADLATILNDAAILAVRTNENEITIRDIDEAIDRRIAGPAKSNKSLSAEEKKMIAYHESGHAIIGLMIPYSDKVQKVTIIPRGRTGGHVLMTPEDDRFTMTKNELEARIIGYLGGRASEEVFFKDISTGASNDIEVATRIARAMVTQYGMSSLGPIQYESDQSSVFLGRDYNNVQKNFSSQVANEIDAEVRKIIEHAHQVAIDTITKYADKVTLIANTLIEKETITAEEIHYLVEHGELPPSSNTVNPAKVAPKTELNDETKPEAKPANTEKKDDAENKPQDSETK